MSKSKKNLLQEIFNILGKDKSIRQDLLKFFNDPKNKEKYQKILNLLRPLLRLGAKLLKLSTREIEVVIEILEMVVAASLYCKKNVLDNPEVRKAISEYFNKSTDAGRQVISSVSQFIDSALSKVRRKSA